MPRFLGYVNTPTFDCLRSRSENCTIKHGPRFEAGYIGIPTIRPTLFQLRQPSPLDNYVNSASVYKRFSSLSIPNSDSFEQTLYSITRFLDMKNENTKTFRIHSLIGKCENYYVSTFYLRNALTTGQVWLQSVDFWHDCNHDCWHNLEIIEITHFDIY